MSEQTTPERRWNDSDKVWEEWDEGSGIWRVVSSDSNDTDTRTDNPDPARVGHANDPRNPDDPSRLTQPELDPSETAVEQTEKFVFLNGNRNTPALLLGDDPGNETNGTDNVLIVSFGSAVSVPRNTVSDTEGTPETE